ncbi:hypothetical protein [Acidicapsa acidisoli]|uniref:hypothetical protein n=1 Tax=Acidicapsa acidisoli TaxID=1615681 RepID=UPI0021E0E050|nr:hypothetical protein [Acidicapsa acidisoli]
MTTNISELTEITNKTNDTFYMYVWDNAHEGTYKPYDESSDWYYPNEGKWLTIGPKAHLRADDCGIPDGGKSAGHERARVIFKKLGNEKRLQGDPGRGLRVNRVGNGDGTDSLEFRNHATGETLYSFKVPTDMHQSLLLLFGGPEEGVQFRQKDIATSGEAKLKQAGEVMEKILDLAVNLAKIVAESV